MLLPERPLCYLYERNIMSFDIDTHLRRVADIGGNGTYESRTAIRNEINRLEMVAVAAVLQREAAIKALTDEVEHSVRADAEIARLKEQYLQLSSQHLLLEREAREKVLATKIGMLREAAGIVRGMDSTSEAATHLEGIADGMVE